MDANADARVSTIALCELRSGELMSMCMKKCHGKKNFLEMFWQSDCLSNLAILYDLCIPLLTITVRGVSNK